MSGSWEYDRSQSIAHERNLETQSLKLAQTFAEKGIAGKCVLSVDHGKISVTIEYFTPKKEEGK